MGSHSYEISLRIIRFSAQVALGKMKTLVNKMMGLNRLYGLAFVTLLVLQVSPFICLFLLSNLFNEPESETGI